jgi:hypothetical protein
MQKGLLLLLLCARILLLLLYGGAPPHSPSSWHASCVQAGGDRLAVAGATLACAVAGINE